MRIYEVILSHSNASSSARRLELDGRVYTITITIKSLNNHLKYPVSKTLPQLFY